MARRSGQRIEYVGGAAEPFAMVPRDARLSAPVPVKWLASVRDGLGRVVSWKLFATQQEALRFAREDAARPGKIRVASVTRFQVAGQPVPESSHGETAADRAVRMNRLDHSPTMREIAFTRFPALALDAETLTELDSFLDLVPVPFDDESIPY